MNAEFAKHAAASAFLCCPVLLRVSDSQDRDLLRPPVWARWLDLFAVILLAVAGIAAIVGGIRFRIAFVRVSLTSPLRIVTAAVAVAAVRHLLAPRIPIYRDLPMRVREWRRTTLIDDIDARAATPMPGRVAAAVIGIFTVLALIMTYPLVTRMSDGLSDPGDPLLNTWALQWVAHQLITSPAHLFDGNIFYPERHALAYSEPMLPQGIMALPLVAVGASPVLIYNLLLIAGFTLTGWSMCLVVRSWTGDWAAAVLSGTILAFNAHVLSRIPHLQAQHVEFLPAALFALDALLTRPNVRRAVSLACWAALQATTSIYLLAATLFALAAGIIARPQDWLGRRFIPFLRALAVATLLAVIVLVPFLLPYYHVSHDLGLSRSLSDADMYAATWKDYLSTPSRLWYSWWSYRFFAGTALFPGAVGLILSAVALAGGDAWRDSRARLCLAVGIAGVALSFGPRMPGYSLLYTIVPVLRAIRATARFGYLATLAVAALAGFGAVRVRRMAPASMQPAIMATLIACAFAESVAAPLRLTRFDGIPPIYARVPRDSSTRVVEIPFFGSTSSHFHASYMLNSTAHWRPIVNGYSGFQPPSFYQHADALQGFPDATSIKLLHDLAVTHVFVHTTQVSAETRAAISQEGRLKLVETFGSIALYRLE